MKLWVGLQVLLMGLIFIGCTRVGPDMVHKDRFDNTTEVSEFWIDSTDHHSKRSLTYALALITLLDSEEKAGGSVVIPIN